MNINDFAVAISKLEGGKKNLSIAQIKEVLKCANHILDGELYPAIKEVPTDAQEG